MQARLLRSEIGRCIGSLNSIVEEKWKKCRWYTNVQVPLPHILFLKLVYPRHFSSLYQALPPVLVSTTITFTNLCND